MPLDDVDAYVDQTAPLLGLTIDSAWKPRVAAFVRLAQSMAQLVEESGALEGSDSASVFTLREIP
jgi:1-carboxybiuret hydrolase subunit AtzG-like protein